MTLKYTQKKAAKSGMTLIELTVVILVLLSLISILFVGARAWKRGSDRAGCIMNQRNVQQGVRSLQNIEGYEPEETYAGTIVSDVIGADKFVESTPECPDKDGGYTPAGDDFPAIGTIYYPCDLAGDPDKHEPKNFSDW